MNRRARKKAATRKTLLDTALALFAQRGIYAPSIEEITKGADLGKGTFYQYFPSREEVIAALVRQGFDELLDQVTREVEGAQEEKLFVKKVLEAHGAFFHTHPDYLLLFHQARGWLKLPGEQDSPIREEFERYVARIAEIVPKGRQRGLNLAVKRRRTAEVLAGFVSGVLSFHYILEGGIDSSPDLLGDMMLVAEMIVG